MSSDDGLDAYLEALKSKKKRKPSFHDPAQLFDAPPDRTEDLDTLQEIKEAPESPGLLAAAQEEKFLRPIL